LNQNKLTKEIVLHSFNLIKLKDFISFIEKNNFLNLNSNELFLSVSEDDTSVINISYFREENDDEFSSRLEMYKNIYLQNEQKKKQREDQIRNMLFKELII
jgi:hypothetical protein